MVATRPSCGVVHLVSFMSAYSITYKTSNTHLPVWVLTCPPCHSEGMIGYLRHNQCKFHMVMERTKWERRHSVDRDVFYIEIAPQQVLDRLIDSTYSKGGAVNLLPNEKLADLFEEEPLLFPEPEFDESMKEWEESPFSGLRDSKTIKSKYRELSKVYHPDCGGNADEFSQLNAQFQQAMRALV